MHNKIASDYVCKDNGSNYRLTIAENGIVINFWTDDPQLTDESRWIKANPKYIKNKEIFKEVSVYSPPNNNGNAGSFAFSSGKFARNKIKEVYSKAHKALCDFENNRLEYYRLLEKSSKR